MKTSRFRSPEGLHLEQAEEGIPIGDVCRKVGTSQATFYAWRSRLGSRLIQVHHRMTAAISTAARTFRASLS